MRLNFKALPAGLEAGLLALADKHGFTNTGDGFPVTVRHAPDSGSLTVCLRADGAEISYARQTHFFRGVGLLLEERRAGRTGVIEERVCFDTIGVMFDLSQGNAAVRVRAMRDIIDRMAIMGLNMLMLYMEDTFVLPGHPYFGYMRARYTQEEFRAIDDYAARFGIEVIPTVQTLAHLIDVLKWEAYSDVSENADILLVGQESTYRFIEQMLRCVSAPFRSKRIHIGMDEAWRLGMDRYRDINGERHKFDIMREHLARVAEITDRLGLTPLMWSDMYFNTPDLEGYGNNFNPDVVIPEEVIREVPASVGLVFWEYNRVDGDFYKAVIKRHQAFERKVFFAGGVYNCHGFGVNNGLAFETIPVSLAACRETGVRDAFLTVWGDDGTENNIFSVLPALQLYAEEAYRRERGRPAVLEERFAVCTGGVLEDFASLRYLDETPGVTRGNPHMCNPCKYLCWQNAMLGLFDKNIEGLAMNAHYQEWERSFAGASERNAGYEGVFEMARALCSVLAVKSELGLQLRRAYLIGDKDELSRLAEEVIPDLLERYRRLRLLHRKHWFDTNKPEGWEIIDLRYGTQLNGLDTARYRLLSYLSGETDSLGELENERVEFPCAHDLPSVFMYKRIVSASRVSQCDTTQAGGV